MILDKTVFVSKISPDSTPNKEYYPTYSGFLFGGVRSAAVKMNIQPASAELTMMAEGEMFKTYKAFTMASGVVEGMRVTVSGTNDTYTVKGREKYDYIVGQHYELVLIKSTR